jgi:glycosyltransferase involved in cell wall biosynthesis
MKVLELVEATACGVGRHVIDLTSGLLSRGAQVDLFYSGLRADNVFREDLRRLEGTPGFFQRHVEIEHEPSVNDLAVSLALRKHLMERGPFHLVHSHSTKAGLIGRLGLAQTSIKRVYSPHAFLAMDPNRSPVSRRLGRFLESALAGMCDAVVTVSSEEHSYALQMGIPAEKLCLIRNGVAVPTVDRLSSRGDLRRSWSLGDDEVCIGFVGRLAPQKAPSVALRAFALSGLGKAARLVIIGDGPLRAEMQGLAESLGVRVTWLGEQNAKTVMHAFDVFLLSSDSEGNPIVVLEAMARGLPIVATSVGGISETVRPGVNGFVAPVRGVREIAAALETLTRDAALRDRMGKASLALSRNFSLDQMVDQTAELYDQVVSGAWKSRASVALKLAPH